MELLKTLGKTVAITFKRLYDILATYLLFWVLYVVAVGTAIHFALPHLWQALGVANPDLVWQEMARPLNQDVATLRLVMIGLVHLVVFIVVRKPISWIQPHFESAFDKIAGFFERVTSERFSLRAFGEALFSLAVTALLIPFVLQPTLVRGWDMNAWAERGVNLIDGSAVIDLPDSTIAYYRQFTAEPVIAEQGLDDAELDDLFAEYEAYESAEQNLVEEDVPPSVPGGTIREPGGVPYTEDTIRMKVAPMASGRPAMDRWNDNIWTAVSEDPQMFAQVKAFMYVESGGRQYAVSNTGCLGLMQFCSRTAKDHPYRQVFGVGEVYACGCQRTSCDVDRGVARKLESGEMSVVVDQEADFPCELTDARFDPDKAIGAGYLYVKRLHSRYGGNIYLMYVGYNSGPAVADYVWEKVGRDPNVGLDQIELHLTDGLRPYQGDRSPRRARGLVNIHLPKIKRAYDRYAEQVVEEGAVQASSLGGADAACVSPVDRCVGGDVCISNMPLRPIIRL